MSTKDEMLAEAYRRGLLKGPKKVAYEEAIRRGVVKAEPAQRALVDARKRSAATPAPLRALTQGALAGFSDELDAVGAGVETRLGNLGRRLQGKRVPYTARQAETAVRQSEREAQAAFATRRPVLNAGLQVTGGVATGGAGAGFIRGAAGAGAAIGRNALVGAAYGGAAGAGNATGNALQRLPAAARGAAVGGAAGGALSAGGVVVGRSAAQARARPVTPQRRLAQQGVRLTPGQMTGGVLRRAEDAATSVPILGDAIRGARVRGIEDYNRVAIDRSLAPVGRRLPDGVNVGREGVTDATTQISQAYQQALAPVRVAADPQLMSDVSAVAQRPGLTPDIARDLQAVIDNTITPRLTNGVVDGQTWKAVDSEIGAMMRSADNASANQPVQRYLRDALGDLRTAWGGALQRQDPTAFAAVRQADEATANLVRVRQASQYQGTSARGGVFSPSDLNRAVQGTDTSAGNRAFAQGDALMQDLTDDAMQVLPQTVPDSGTPFRSLVTAGGLTGGGMTLGLDPVAVAVGGGLTGTAAAVYTRPVQDALNSIYRASNPGQAREGLARLSRLAAQNPALVPVLEDAQRRLSGQPDRVPAR